MCFKLAFCCEDKYAHIFATKPVLLKLPHSGIQLFGSLNWLKLVVPDDCRYTALPGMKNIFLYNNAQFI